MTKAKKPQFGGLPPRYNFVLNPYPDMRVSSCPLCDQKTGQRKIPLFIHIDPLYSIALNYTCRYCRACDLLIAHKDEIEHLLTGLFSQMAPEAVGNAYLIIGTMEKAAWREGLERPRPVAEMLQYTSDFVTNYYEMRVTQAGWFKDDQEPPVMEPPPSQEWVKSRSGAISR